MRNAPFSVYHDVAVVSILELKNVAEDGVGGHGLDEIASGPLKCDRLLRTELEQEERGEVVDLGSSHLVARRSVGDDVDDARPRTGSEHAVRLDLEVKAVDIEHVLELGNDLQSEHVLPAIVADLEDGREHRLFTALAGLPTLATLQRGEAFVCSAILAVVLGVLATD